MKPPNQKWSFRHVRELLPTERIRAPRQSLSLGSDPRPAVLDLVVQGLNGSTSVREALSTGESDALVVIHDGDVVAEWLGDGVADDEPHLVFSVTKSITGLLAAALAGAGLLDLEANLVDYLPEAEGSGFGTATLRHLLDMEASYAFVEDYSPGPDVTAYRHSVGWYPAPEGAPALREFLLTRQQEGEHGQVFRYLSPTCDLMGMVCARAAGTTWAQAVSTYLWQPMGAEADADVTVDREGSPRAAGGFSAVPRDIARLGMLVARKGAGVIPEAFIDDIIHGGDPEHWANGDFATFLPGGAYRSYWYQPRVDDDVVCGVGIYGQMLYVDVPRQVVVVIQSSWSEPDNQLRVEANLDICRTIARSFDAE